MSYSNKPKRVRLEHLLVIMILLGLSVGNSMWLVSRVYQGVSEAATPSFTADSLLSQRSGFAKDVTGGYGGEDYMVTNLNDSGAGSLRNGAETTGKKWIRFAVSGTITLKTMIKMTDNKTIDGRGADITITAKGLEIRGKQNVIIENIKLIKAGTVVDQDDAVRIWEGADLVWVDHCTLSEGTDGLIDVTYAVEAHPTRVTISWNNFSHHFKTMLFSASPDHLEDHNIEVTVHHNFFDGTLDRHPTVRRGKVNFYNNYLRNWKEHAIKAFYGAQLLSESNIFEAGTRKQAIVYLLPQAAEPGFTQSIGDVLLNGATVETNHPEKIFNPALYYPHQVDTANDALKIKLIGQTGWRAVDQISATSISVPSTPSTPQTPTTPATPSTTPSSTPSNTPSTPSNPSTSSQPVVVTLPSPSSSVSGTYVVPVISDEPSAQVEVLLNGHPATSKIDTTTLKNGQHTVTVKTTQPDGSIDTTIQTVDVQNDLNPYEEVRNYVLSKWAGKSGRTLNVMFGGFSMAGASAVGGSFYFITEQLSGFLVRRKLY